MFRRVIIPLLLLALGVAGLMTLARSRPQPEPLAVQEKVWPVAVESVRRASLAPTITLYARVDSPRVATLTAAVTADVTQVWALEGETAAAGQELVRLDERDAWLEVNQREAEVSEIEAELVREDIAHDNDQRALVLERKLLELIQRDVERAQMLATREVGSASRLDEARQAEARQMLALDTRRRSIAEHDSRKAGLAARAQRSSAVLERARLDAERTVIRAPFAGPIANVSVSPGDRVRAGDRLLSIYDAQRLEFRAQIPTRYLAQLRSSLGKQSVVARAQVDGARLSARLDRLGAEVERGRGGTDAYFRIVDSGEVDIELGRSVELVVPLPAIDDVIAIPQEALYGTNRVYVLVDGRMRSLPVERVGEYVDDHGQRRVLIGGGAMSEDVPLIVTQLPNAVDGLRVQVTQPR